MGKYDKAIESYKENISALDFLRSVGARNIRGANSKWIIHSCLIDDYEPHHSNRDNNPSAAINSENKTYNCFSYGTLSFEKLLDLIFEGNSVRKIEFLRGLPQSQKDDFLELFNKKLNPTTSHKGNVKLSDSVFSGMVRDYEYMESERGISEEVCATHGILFDDTIKSVVIPLYENLGEEEALVGYQKRNLKTGMPKYVNSEGLYKESLLYYGSGAKESKEIILVESIMSVLRLETLGYDNAVATLGSVVFDEQLYKLKKHKSIILWFDDDLSGIKGAKNFIRKTNGNFNIHVVVSDRRNFDPADMDIEGVRRNLSKKMNLIEAVDFLKKAERVLKSEQEKARS